MNEIATKIDRRQDIENRMRQEGVPDLAIRTFLYYYKQLVDGETGMIAEDTIRPVHDLPDREKLDAEYGEIGQDALGRTVLLKLNGGLGTGMGLQDAKSLLEVREGLTFLDIIAKQAIDRDVPLVLMNSFSTAESSRKRLKQRTALDQDLPIDFLQHKVPKIAQDGLAPVDWQQQPALEWCPPGHGDIYTALLTTGMLDKLRDAGYQYLFVSNSDNLGAVIDTVLLGYFCRQNLPFMMEVADRTYADRKGGHLARDENGQLLLRESAQCPDEDQEAFQNIEKHRYFNTNNLWIRLNALHDLLRAKNGIMGLPMIRNAKTVDPRNASSTSVYQLETAMGAAIAVFDGAGAIRVPRSRFAPVKTTNELLAVRSDAYVLNPDHTLTLHPDRKGKPCVVNLDRTYFKTVDQLDERFPAGPPSLLQCESLHVEGDVRFGEGVQCEGAVRILNHTPVQVKVEDEARVEGERIFQ